MIADTSAVIWKELHELWRAGNGRSSRGAVLLTVGVFGIAWPLMFGRSVVTNPVTAAPWLWVPMLLVGQVVIDAFAGERDRHTLETLLASRLPASAIVAGKLISAVSYGSVIALAVVLLGVFVVQLTTGGSVPLEPSVGAGAAVAFVLLATMVAGVAALVSIRTSVRQAAQLFGIGLVGITLVPVLLAGLVPESMRHSIESALAGLSPAAGFALVVVVLVLVDVALVGAALARFRRADIVLD